MEPFVHIYGSYDSTFDDTTESRVREILTAVDAKPMWAASFPPSLVPSVTEEKAQDEQPQGDQAQYRIVTQAGLPKIRSTRAAELAV